jgi:hypothetical protein
VNSNVELMAVFGERLGRIFCSASKENAAKVESLVQARGISCHYLGESAGTGLTIKVRGATCIDLPLDQYRPVYDRTIRKVME